MRQFLAKLMTAVVMAGAMMGVMLVPVSRAAALSATNVMAVETNIIGGGNVDTDADNGKEAIMDILNLVRNILVYGLGVVAVLGVVIAGILYMTARDNEQQVTLAKRRLFEVVIGLIAWAVMFAVLEWLLPTGAPTE